MIVETSYGVYMAISVVLTVWVARTLFRNGRVFLVDACHGNQPLADSLNHLLVVGFYLINIGYVTLMLRLGTRPETTQEAIEYLSTKIGLVMLILGGMHFINLMIFSKMRRGAMEHASVGRAYTLGPELVNPSVEAMRRAKGTADADGV